MNLKLRIGEMLQGRSLGTGGDVCDSEAVALQKRQEDEAHKLYMRRLFMARAHELDELRKIMRVRLRKSEGGALSGRVKGASAAAVTRPPGGVDGTQLISLINELEVKVLSEPMGLTGLPRERPDRPVTSGRDTLWPTHSGSSKVNALDDPALMVAARRWNPAADLLIKALCGGELPGGTDWATRSAIDLFELGGQTERAAAMRQQYRQIRGQDPMRMLPPRLNAPVTGRLHVGAATPWTCPNHLGLEAASQLQGLLSRVRAGTPLVFDWTPVESVDVKAMDGLQQWMVTATRSRQVFVHLGLSKLIRTVRQELQNQNFSREIWNLWLALLNWTGFHTAHGKAAGAYARRFQCETPAYRSLVCVCQSVSPRPDGAPGDLVCAARFMGDLTQEHAQELDRLEVRAPLRGRVVVLDLRQLMSMDFFFAADLLNWIIRRHARGETVAIAYAHPLLSHFLQMLGLQDYAKVHGFLVPVPTR